MFRRSEEVRRESWREENIRRECVCLCWEEEVEEEEDRGEPALSD